MRVAAAWVCVVAACGGGLPIESAPDAELPDPCLACRYVEEDPVILLAGPPSDKRCVILTGQSNAGGEGRSTELTGGDVALATPYAPVLFSDRRASGTSFPPTWTTYPLAPVQPRNFSSLDRFGVELTMARDLVAARPSVRWVVIKAAIGGTTLNDQWKPSLGTFFTEVHDWIDTQIAALGCTPAAYIWIQGESDAEQVSRANNYGTNLTAFITAVRLRYSNIPFIFGRLHVNTTATYTSTVRTKQADVAGAVSGTHLIDQDGGTLRADLTHYTTPSVIQLGHDYATKVLEVSP